MKRLLTALAFGVLIGVMPAAAQEETACEIDLTSVDAAYEAAQEAVAAGDTEAALQQLADLRAAIDQIEDGCALPVALTEVYEWHDGTFSISYPEGWVFNDTEEDNFVFFGSSSRAINEAMEAQDTPQISSGEQLIAVIGGTGADLGFGLPEDAELSEILTAFTEEMKSDYPSIGAAEALTINDRRAGLVEFSEATFDGSFLFIEIERGAYYVGVIGVASAGEGEALRPILLDMAESIDLS